MLKDIPFRVRLIGGVYGKQNKYLNETRELIDQLKLNEIISIEDCVRTVRGIYESSHLLIVPSQRPDAFPTVALEAMSAGTPVVAYAIGGLSEMLEYDDECLAKRGDYADLADKIIPFVLDEAFRVKVAKRQNLRYRNNFTYEHYQDRLRTTLELGVGSLRESYVR